MTTDDRNVMMTESKVQVNEFLEWIDKRSYVYTFGKEKDNGKEIYVVVVWKKSRRKGLT